MSNSKTTEEILKKNTEAVTFLGSTDCNKSDLVDLTCAAPFQGERPPFTAFLLSMAINETTHYPDVDDPVLVDSVVEYFKRHGVNFSENLTKQRDYVTVSTSTFTIITDLLNSRKDEKKTSPDGTFHKATRKILFPTPTFGPYLGAIPMDKGYETCFTQSSKKNGYKLDIETLKETIKSEKPGILILTNPTNPTGQLYSESELKEIAKICEENNVFIISDEIFADIRPKVSGKEVPSIAKFVSDPKKVFITSGLGKAYGQTGDRISFCYSDPENLTWHATIMNAGVSQSVIKSAPATLCPKLVGTSELRKIEQNIAAMGRFFTNPDSASSKPALQRSSSSLSVYDKNPSREFFALAKDKLKRYVNENIALVTNLNKIISYATQGKKKDFIDTNKINKFAKKLEKINKLEELKNLKTEAIDANDLLPKEITDALDSVSKKALGELDNYREENNKRRNENLEITNQQINKINKKLSLLYKDKESPKYIKIITPDSGNIALLDFSELKGKDFLGQRVETGLKIAKVLYEQCGILLVPGEGYMLPTEDMTCRIVISNKNDLERAFNKISYEISQVTTVPNPIPPGPLQGARLDSQETISQLDGSSRR